jgi:hypothetical protein
LSYDIIFSDGTWSYRIDEEGILAVLTDEVDGNGDYREFHAIGPDEMEAFIEWLTGESRRKAKLRENDKA